MRPVRCNPRPTLAIAVAIAFALSAPIAAATAVTRDVEVTPGSVRDGRLTVLPAMSLLRDVDGHGTWPVAIVNGGDDEVVLGLQVTTTEPDGDGVGPGDRVVSWALLPRTTITVPAGARADLSVALTPPRDALPVAISFVATTIGSEAIEAVANLVLWPPGTTAEVTLDANSEGVAVTSDIPAIVSLRLRGSAAPWPSRTSDVGPLVLLGATPRTIDFAAPRSLLGTGQVAAVAAIDGVEVARASAGQVLTVGGIAVLVVLAVLLGGAVAVGARAGRRRSAGKVG